MKEVLRAWKGRRVLVVGDLILDEYLYGTTDRVSREAPVVVIRYDGSSWSAGGAANAAANIVSLGGLASVGGVTGRDEEAGKLVEILGKTGVDTGGVVAAAGLVTTSKTRVLAGDLHSQRQQVVRIDRESRGGLKPAIERRLVARMEKKLRRCDAVILSDYGQGVFGGGVAKSLMDMASAAGIPVVTDSRFNLAHFRGTTTATPNEVEAAEAAGIDPAGDDALERTGRRLLRMLAADSILVTRGRLGMALFRKRRRTLTAGVVGSSEATDVTGAGDTVVAAVALSLAAGAGMKEAMLAANVAASIVVMKRGTAVASPREILGTLPALLEREGEGG